MRQLLTIILINLVEYRLILADFHTILQDICYIHMKKQKIKVNNQENKHSPLLAFNLLFNGGDTHVNIHLWNHKNSKNPNLSKCT